MRSRPFWLRLAIIALIGVAASACVSKTVKTTSVPAVNTGNQHTPEEQLIDVGIVIFDPGVDAAKEQEFMFPEVRRAEARYMPYLLAEAMQSSTAWGAVRVIPNENQSIDLMVTGTILQSHGEELRLRLVAQDSTGRIWLDTTYLANASHYSYATTSRERVDPFQAVYNQVANELLLAQQQLTPEELARIRLVTELRFAQSMSPDSFAGHLSNDEDGNYKVVRLPAENDPMLARVRQIRERDYLFIDTLQEYYASFNSQMSGPYQEWRKLSYTEAIALQELKAESTRNLITGAVLVVAGIAAQGGDYTSRSAGNVAILGGGALVKSGLDARSEAEIHVQALEELGLSLESEIAPQVIELEDRTVTLTGTVEQQYEQWRELLREIYQAEVGKPMPLAQVQAQGAEI